MFQTRVRGREQIKYEHIERCIPELDVYHLINPSQEGWAVPVLQHFYKHADQPVIPSSLADTPCSDLGVDGLLNQLNGILCTSYPLTSPLFFLFKAYIAKCYDFGTAFGHLRPLWHNSSIKMKLRKREVLDRQMREEVLVNGIIISRFVPPRRVWDLYSNRVVPWWGRLPKPMGYITRVDG